MKFSQILKEYAENKKRHGLKESISAEELHKLRRRFENGDFDECEQSSKRERTSNRSALKERLATLRIKKRIAEARKRRLEEDVKENKSCCGGKCDRPSRKIRPTKTNRFIRNRDDEEDETFSESERRPVTKSLFKERLERIRRHNRIKEAIAKRRSLRESMKNRAMYRLRKSRMQEEGEVVDAVSGEGMTPDTTTTDVNATANQTAMNPADVASTIEQIKTEIDNLATQLGIQTEPMDTNTDSNIPPEGDVNMDTMPSTEGTDQTQPVMTEGKKFMIRRSIGKIKEALKDKQVARVFEKKYPLSYSSIINLIDGPINPCDSVMNCDTVINQVDKTPYKVNTENDKSLLDKVVSLNQLIKGTEKDVVRWGQDKIDYKFNESATEKMVSDKIKENQDRWDFAKIIKSGVLN